jgi:hypothetical protein
MTSPAEEIRRILSGLPRHEPPAIPLQLLLVRLADARRRTFAAISATIAAGLIIGLTFRSVPREPPVNLELHIVQVDSAEGGRAVDAATDAPPGFDRP